MAGGNPQQERHEHDFYASPPDVTRALLRRYRFEGPIHECACGNGAMSMALQMAGYEVISTDIRPLGVGTRRDFFGIDERLAPTIVTNPPFKLAPQFIEHALGTLKVKALALVLKSTFWHAKSRKSLYDRFTPSAIHPLLWRPDFRSLGSPTMECMWTVWLAGHDGPPRYEPMERPA